MRIFLVTFLLLGGCFPHQQGSLRVPSKEYADGVMGRKVAVSRRSLHQQEEPRAQVRLAADETGGEPITNLNAENLAPAEHSIDVPAPVGRQEEMMASLDYNGPLSLGDPGLTASLWREGRGTNYFHDDRAWQSMDLVTVLITENAEAKSEADTKLKRKSTLQAAIEKFIGVEIFADKKNDTIDPTALLSATTETEFDGEGETTRKGKLKASISAMVVEVLPSGVLRIEGEKIISTNGEEELLVLSGLVRPRDINSQNEIDSRKIANMRIDYRGSGTVGRQQGPGWGQTIIETLWPF
jgi:flagellar L-ring protein FlgH